MIRGLVPGLIACVVGVSACGLDLERRDGSLRIFVVMAEPDVATPSAGRFRITIEHADSTSEIDREVAPEILIESMPAGESTVWLELSDGTLRSNEARIDVIEGEEARVGLWMLADPDRDADGDGLVARVDNCPFDANAEQADGDRDGLGDACDNCPTYPRPQGDLDGDGFGDHCDPDQDGDGTLDVLDRCPRDPSGTTDLDADGICDPSDNCPQSANFEQDDCDRDGLGDACDLDIDGDGVPNNADSCPFSPLETCSDDPSACGVVGG